MAKKKVIQPFGSCSSCWQYHDDALKVPVILPLEEPNIIIIKDLAFSKDSRADRLLADSCKKWGAEPIILSARQCLIFGAPNLEEIKRNRELFLLPTTETYKTLPIVALGGYASSCVAGGKCTDTSMVNKVLHLYDRPCAFTYSLEYYLENGRSSYVLEHIENTIKAALRPIEEPKWISGVPFGKSLEKIVIDVEANNAEYPFTGNNKCSLIGVMPFGKPPYLVSPERISEKQKQEILENTRLVVGHNILFDLVHLAHIGIRFPYARIHDTMIYTKNLFPNEPFYGLKPLAKKYGSFPHWDAWFASKVRSKDLDVNNPEEWRKLCDYNAYDLYATECLYNLQRKEYPPFTLEMDYLKYVLKMVNNGFHVDKGKLEELLAETTSKLADVEAAVRKEFSLGVDFNFNSPTQVLNFLQKQIPKINGTGADVLLEYKDEHPFVEKLLEIRDLSKLKGTGLEGLKDYLDQSGQVHSNYAVHGAETGRSSSSSPNLQNTDPRVRPLFTSRFPGGRLLHTDLAGIEYRLIGHISQDKVLLDVFNSGKDIHDEMYMALFGVPPPNKVERKKAKTGNFCGVYGGGYKKFILSTGMEDCEESGRLFKVVSNRYPGVQKWKEGVIRELHRSKCVRNLFGRIRRFDYVDMDAEREAINWVIQSSGHDILDIYLMELCDLLADDELFKTLLVSEVHDSVTFDSPEYEYEDAYKIISELAKDLNPLILEAFGVKMRVPIIADTEIMGHWA